MNPGWRFALASVVGTSHLKTGLGCQDASECRVYRSQDGKPILFAVASDGAGSAKFADVGSRLACETLLEAVGEFFESGGEVSKISASLAAEWLTRFHNAIEAKSHEFVATPRDFACTLLVAVIGAATAVFWQIGDGCIVIRSAREEEYCWVFWPERGEYENVTYFATEENSAQHMQFDAVPGEIAELAVLTDGLQSLALHYESGAAHGPFFRGLFPALDSSTPGFSERLSRALAQFLASERVNARTDDDKTLILATRTVPASTEASGPISETVSDASAV